jgi:EAL domain-containing protein (putative c-di-GMP-specific phosphodiesterase class I)
MQKSIDHLTQQQKNSQATSLFVSLSDCALSDKILQQAVRQHIKTARMDAGKLYVQLSAAAVIGQNTAARNFIAEARQIGLNVVIDRMDLQRIDSENLTGIDIAYIAIDCHNGSGSAESTINDGILRGAVALAKKLGAMTIARRVENAEIFSLLWGAGVDYIQGDYLSPALSSPDHHFSEEQTLSSDAALPAFNLRVAG